MRFVIEADESGIGDGVLALLDEMEKGNIAWVSFHARPRGMGMEERQFNLALVGVGVVSDEQVTETSDTQAFDAWLDLCASAVSRFSDREFAQWMFAVGMDGTPAERLVRGKRALEALVVEHDQ